MRKSALTALIAAGLSSSLDAAPTAPTKQATPTVDQAAIPANAMRLSALLNPSDRMVEFGLKGFETGFETALKQSPKDAAVYDANPGLREAVFAAGQPVIRKYMEVSTPRRQQTYARFYAAKFSPEEIDQLISFYSTPTGTKVIAAMYSGVSLDKIAQSMAKEGNDKLTAKTVSELGDTATAQLPDKFDADDWKTLFTFTATPAHAKLMKVVPEFSQLVADVENESDPELDADLDKAVSAAVQAYLAKHKGKPGS